MEDRPHLALTCWLGPWRTGSEAPLYIISTPDRLSNPGMLVPKPLTGQICMLAGAECRPRPQLSSRVFRT